MPQKYCVGMAELRIARAPDTLATYGIGSCVIVVMYDELQKLGGIVHIVLPDSTGISVDKVNPRKFADTAVPLLFQTMLHTGAVKKHLRVKLVGGAEMFPPSGDGFSSCIGAKNIECTRNALRDLGIPVVSQDVGGKSGRSLEFNLENGRVSVSVLGKESKEI
ncbi:MAG: chemotaxis protein CheD [Candidatus Riflebacteria bacterium]|nr:chemotaxis protein CheD [Candidatus Riflebacteria bacterium]